MNKIWLKLSAVIVLLLLVLMGVVFHFFTYRQIGMEREELHNTMERTAKLIASIRFANPDDITLYQDWISRILDSEAGHGLIYIAIFDDTRRLIAYAIDPQDLAVDAEFLTPDEEYDLVLRLSKGQIAEESWNDFDHLSVTIRLGGEARGKVDVGFSLIEFNNRVQRKLLANIYILVSAFVGVVILSVLVGRRITKPLNTLSDAMREVSKGEYDIQVENRSNDEIGKLAASFNYMTRRMREKAAIEDFSRDLVFSFEHNKLVQLVTERIIDYMGAKQGALFLIENRGAKTFLVSAWGHPLKLAASIRMEFDEECQRECLQKTEPFSPKELKNRSEFDKLLHALRQQVEFNRVELIAPLVSQGETLGFLLLSDEADGTLYDPEEKMFLRTLVHQAGLAIRNSFLLRELTEKERLKRELEIARSVQQSLLPVSEPKLPGLDISGVCIPAAEVGGDYYDYFYIDKNRIGIAVADVSGKGASAAFYMAEIKGMMTSLADLVASPKELTTQLNKYLNKNIDKRVFATMIYGVLDVKTRQFVYVRAGHNAVVIKRAGHHEDVDVFIPQGMGLGLVDDVTFRDNIEEHQISMDKGDLLFLYTDGISEAMNNNREEFGEERLYNIVASNHLDNTADTQRRIMRRINEFVQDAKQHDDITMVIAQFV